MHALAGCCDYMTNKRTRLRMEIAVTTLPHTFKRIRLNLARSKEFPQGSERHGYEFVAPLDDKGHIDVKLWHGKLGYPVQLRYMGEPLCYLVAESGALNTLVHAWVYESASDREQKRAKMMQDPDWKVFLAEN